MLHSGTVPQRGGTPVNIREALVDGARWAGKEFVCLSGGGNEAVESEEAVATATAPRR